MRWPIAYTVAVAFAVGCTSVPHDAPGTVGSSIALLPSGRVAVVNPDQGSVSILDPDSLVPVVTTSVGGEPHQLLVTRGGTIVVATYRGGDLVELDGAGALVRRTPVCAGPYGLAETPDASSLVVTCEWEGAVYRIDASTLVGSVLATELTRPRAVATLGTRVFVGELTAGRVAIIDGDSPPRRISLVPSTATYRPALTAMTADLITALRPAFGRVYAAHELVDHEGHDNGEQVAADYGTVVDDNPKINPALTVMDEPATEFPPTYARFTSPALAFSGPSAVAALPPNLILVTHVSTANVAVIDADATDPTRRVIGSYVVGAGPSGIAIDPLHERAFVDNAFDGSVSRLDLSRAAGLSMPAELTVVRALPSPYSPAALAGRKLFYDATNVHVTPAGVVACASCHPDGGDDGLVWFIDTPSIPRKRRRTQHLANARSDMAPYHWDGEFATMAELVRGTMKDLMAGDTLLVEADTIQPFIDEIVRPAVHAPLDAAAIARGSAIFHSTTAGCSSCHVDNGSDNAFHAPLSPMSLSGDDVIAQVNTPGLRGVFLRAPYFHDGRSPDLHDLVRRTDAPGHGQTRDLSTAQLDDLVTYLESL